MTAVRRSDGFGAEQVGGTATDCNVLSRISCSGSGHERPGPRPRSPARLEPEPDTVRRSVAVRLAPARFEGQPERPVVRRAQPPADPGHVIRIGGRQPGIGRPREEATERRQTVADLAVEPRRRGRFSAGNRSGAERPARRMRSVGDVEAAPDSLAKRWRNGFE